MKTKHFPGAIFMALMILVWQGCRSGEPIPQIASTHVHVIDRTCVVDHLTIEQAILSSLQNTLELRDGTTSKSAEIILALIDGKRFGRVQRLVLPPPKDGQSYKGRKAEVRIFLDSISEFVVTSFKLPVDTSQTYLYQPFIDLMLELEGRLGHPNMDITIWSDALENGVQFSFYRYRDNPDVILSEIDMIIEEMESLYGLCPALKGKEITFYTIPNEDDYALSYSARKTLERFITDHGGAFKIKISQAK